MVTVNLNTANQCDDGFEYETLGEAVEAVGRLAHASAEQFKSDGIERSVTIFIGGSGDLCTQCNERPSTDDFRLCVECEAERAREA